jgi:hypothetical protein
MIAQCLPVHSRFAIWRTLVLVCDVNRHIVGSSLPVFQMNIVLLPFLLCLLFDSDNGGNTFLRIIGIVPDYTAWYPKDTVIHSSSAHMLALVKFLIVETIRTKYVLVRIWSRNTHSSIHVTVNDKDLQCTVDFVKSSNSVPYSPQSLSVKILACDFSHRARSPK